MATYKIPGLPFDIEECWSMAEMGKDVNQNIDSLVDAERLNYIWKTETVKLWEPRLKTLMNSFEQIKGKAEYATFYNIMSEIFTDLVYELEKKSRTRGRSLINKIRQELSNYVYTENSLATSQRYIKWAKMIQDDDITKLNPTENIPADLMLKMSSDMLHHYISGRGGTHEIFLRELLYRWPGNPKQYSSLLSVFKFDVLLPYIRSIKDLMVLLLTLIPPCDEKEKLFANENITSLFVHIDVVNTSSEEPAAATVRGAS